MYIILYYFSEELEGSKGDREEDRERNIDGKETHWLPCVYALTGAGSLSLPRFMTLMRNRTLNPLLCRPSLQPLSQPGFNSPSSGFYSCLAVYLFWEWKVFLYFLFCRLGNGIHIYLFPVCLLCFVVLPKCWPYISLVFPFGFISSEFLC